MKETLISNSKALEDYISLVRSQYEKHGVVKVSCKSGKQRSNKQNASLHKYLALLSEALNDAGYDCFNFFKEGFAMPWNERLVKELIWRPVQQVVIDKKSTTEADTIQYSEIYDVINAHMSQNKHIFVPWPSNESLMYENNTSR